MSKTPSIQESLRRISARVDELHTANLTTNQTIADEYSDSDYAEPDFDESIQSFDEKKNNQSTNIKKLPVVYGTAFVRGTRVFAGVSGTSREYLYLAVAFCEGPINGFKNIYVDGTNITDSKFSGLVSYTTYEGYTWQSADNDLINNFASIGYGSFHKLTGIAYVVCRFTYDEDVFSSFPNLTAEVEGKLVKQSLWGGAGPLDFLKTPADVLADYMTNPIYGAGIDRGHLAWMDSLEYNTVADQSIVDNLTDNNYIQKYEVNAVLDTSKTLLYNIKQILISCFGSLIYQSGWYWLVPGEQQNYNYATLTQKSIINGSIKIGYPSRRNRFNKIKATFINSRKDYKPWVYTEEVSQYLDIDQDIDNTKEITVKHDNNPYRVQQWAQMYLKKSRQGLTFECELEPNWAYATIGNVYLVTHPTPGWISKPFTLTKLTVNNSFRVYGVFVEYNSSTYSAETPGVETALPDTLLPDPFNVSPPTITGASSGTADLLQSGDGSIISRIKLTWTAPSDAFVSHYEIQFKLKSETFWVTAPPAIGIANTETYITGVSDGINYDIRIRSVNTMRQKSIWATTSHFVVGKTEPPNDVATFTVEEQADRTRVFEWTMSTIPLDLAGYIIKYHATAGTAWSSMTDMHYGLHTVSPWENNLLTAGTYDFAIKAVDTSGNESVNERRVRATISAPREGAAFANIRCHVEGWPGTISGATIDGSRLVADLSQTWSSLTTWDAYDTWSGSGSSNIVYTHTAFNLGTSKTFTLEANTTYSGDSVTTEERHSTDGVSYSSYATINTSTQITAQYLQVRITVTKASGEAAYIDQYTVFLKAV